MTADSLKQSLVKILLWLRPTKLHLAVAAAVLLFFVIFFFAFVVQAPKNFPYKYTHNIPEGSGLSGIASSLEEHDIIRSDFWFKVIVVLSGNQSNAFAGDYYFHEKLNIFDVAKRIAVGDFGLTPVNVRILEGSTILEIGETVNSVFPDFNHEEFYALAFERNLEGYLFPDTYSLLPNIKPEQLIELMTATFFQKITELRPVIDEYGLPLNDIIIMASILEKEAFIFEQRRVISGILWNRLSIGMPLQVDAVFPYIIGKNTYELTLDDLDFDSPYNTYKNTGLPIGPISNPSLSSIEAAVTPIGSNYLFYLHDSSGGIHYSIDFEGHKRNKALYLR